MNTPGYICKQCYGPAPMGVGYAIYTHKALQASQDRNQCGCGYSVSPTPSGAESFDGWIIVNPDLPGAILQLQSITPGSPGWRDGAECCQCSNQVDLYTSTLLPAGPNTEVVCHGCLQGSMDAPDSPDRFYSPAEEGR